MDSSEYRKRGKELVDYIADYLDTIRSRRVFPGVSPGYLRPLVPESAPEKGEPWDDIFQDIERVIMPGMTHWQSPHMHAYFPALNSYPSLLGDMLADAIGCLGFTWASSPACTELETVVMDWLGKLIGLPSDFLHSNEQTKGGGVIQTTASEATFVCLLAARSQAIKRVKAVNPDMDDAEVNARLVGYCSDQAHSSVEKAGLIGLVKMRLLPSDESLSLRGDILQAAVDKDREAGLIPFFLCATLGTTGACAFDKLKELGPICLEEDMWMHIDAAYAGTAFICPEFRHVLDGVVFANSFAFNPSKWMMVHFDCTAMWVKDSGALHRTFNVQPLYLKHENTGAAIDYMHWQIPLSKRFRALKLWFVLRSFGVEGLQAHIRKGVRLAKKFEMLVRADKRFEVPAERHLGMVVFRLKGENAATEMLLKRLNRSGQIHMVPAALKGKYVIRFTVTSQYTLDTDIERDWKIIQGAAKGVLSDDGVKATKELVPVVVEEAENDEDEGEEEEEDEEPRQLSRAGKIKREGLKRKDFGISLILSNVPMSPKFINGSFAALFDTNDIIVEFAKDLERGSIDLNGRPIRLSPRKRLKEQNKQYSFDLCLVPPTRRTFRPSKQGSLDSKIEEIFDSSFESDLYDTDTDHTADGSTSSRGEEDTYRHSPRGDGPSRQRDGAVTTHIKARTTDDVALNGEKTKHVNGLSVVCKFCGHLVDG